MGYLHLPINSRIQVFNTQGKTMKPVIAILVSAALLAGCATGGSDSSGAAASKKARVDIKNEKSMTANKEVYIGDFRLTFITEDSASAKSKDPTFMRGGSGTDYAQSNLTAKLTGVPVPVMQAITDEAYANLEASLLDKGYTIRNRSELDNIKDWKKLDTIDSPSESASQKGSGNLLSMMSTAVKGS